MKIKKIAKTILFHDTKPLPHNKWSQWVQYDEYIQTYLLLLHATIVLIIKLTIRYY